MARASPARTGVGNRAVQIDREAYSAQSSTMNHGALRRVRDCAHRFGIPAHGNMRSSLPALRPGALLLRDERWRAAYGPVNNATTEARRRGCDPGRRRAYDDRTASRGPTCSDRRRRSRRGPPKRSGRRGRTPSEHDPSYYQAEAMSDRRATAYDEAGRAVACLVIDATTRLSFIGLR